MLKQFLVSVVILPVLIGILSMRGRKGDADRSTLRTAWIAYAALWFCALYYLRHRWT